MKSRLAFCLAIVLAGALISMSAATAQEAPAAEISGRFTIPVPDNSRLRITNPRMEICAEVPLGVSVVSYRTMVSASATCQLSPGDPLGFWLIYPNGGVDLLSAASGQFPRWTPGGIVTADLGKVPCPEPCRPPDMAGPPDAELTLPTTGAGSHAASWLPWAALVLLAVPVVFFAFAWRRRRRA